jgi:hypothetical protein
VDGFGGFKTSGIETKSPYNFTTLITLWVQNSGYDSQILGWVSTLVGDFWMRLALACCYYTKITEKVLSLDFKTQYIGSSRLVLWSSNPKLSGSADTKMQAAEDYIISIFAFNIFCCLRCWSIRMQFGNKVDRLEITLFCRTVLTGKCKRAAQSGMTSSS